MLVVCCVQCWLCVVSTAGGVLCPMLVVCCVQGWLCVVANVGCELCPILVVCFVQFWLCVVSNVFQIWQCIFLKADKNYYSSRKIN
jgi:hypothetical protein